MGRRPVTEVSVLLEGGGSGTWVGACADHAPPQWERLPPLELRRDVESVGAQVAAAVRDASGTHDAEPVFVLAALSSITSADSAVEIGHDIVAQLNRAARPDSDHRPVVLACNDVMPLLSWRNGAASAAAVCGTGTGYASRSPRGTIRRASGAEYILSDEGGGFDIGLAGLRAAIRGRDGRGAPTSLTAAAIDFGGGSYESLWSFIYDLDAKSLKQRVASFAPHVLTATDADDAAAVRIVKQAADHLAIGIAAVAHSTPSEDTELTLAGSLLCSNTSIGLMTRTLDALTHRGLTFRSVSVANDARQHLVAMCSELITDRTRLVSEVLLDPSAPLAVVQ